MHLLQTGIHYPTQTKATKNMKRILALQHAWECPTGTLGEILQERSIVCEILNVEEERIPAPDGYDAIIALGGPQHVYEADKYPYFAPEKELIRTAIEQDIPFLGICLGGQLLADTLGSAIRLHDTTEIGFFAVPLTIDGMQDPLFAGLPGYQTVFHWHEDIFDLPAEGTLLATSETTTNQAFRYGQHAYGLQYHIELNSDMFDLWLGYPEFKKAIISSIGIDAYTYIERERHAQYGIYRDHTRTLFENFLKIGNLI
jgi:GMP synthase (glutamine-hydrolysing)